MKQVFRRPWVGFGLQAPRACVPHTPYTRCPVSVGRILESDGYLRWQWLLSDTSIRPCISKHPYHSNKPPAATRIRPRQT
ncbi:hypothetical protein QP713_11835, partial [Neisseria mucosa]